MRHVVPRPNLMTTTLDVSQLFAMVVKYSMSLEQDVLLVMITLIQMTPQLTASKIFATIRLNISTLTDLASFVIHSNIQILKVLLVHIEAALKRIVKMELIILMS